MMMMMMTWKMAMTEMKRRLGKVQEKSHSKRSVIERRVRISRLPEKALSARVHPDPLVRKGLLAQLDLTADSEGVQAAPRDEPAAPQNGPAAPQVEPAAPQVERVECQVAWDYPPADLVQTAQAKAQREPAPASVGKNRVDREKGLAVEPQLDPKANLNLDSAVP